MEWKIQNISRSQQIKVDSYDTKCNIFEFEVKKLKGLC